MSAEIQVGKATGSRFRWTLVDDDGKPVAVSAQTFPTADKAERAANTAARHMHGARVVRV